MKQERNIHNEYCTQKVQCSHLVLRQMRNISRRRYRSERHHRAAMYVIRLMNYVQYKWRNTVEDTEAIVKKLVTRDNEVIMIKKDRHAVQR